MEKSSLIYVAGHSGLAGSAICRALRREGYNNILIRRSSELDLRDQAAVRAFFAEYRPEYVFLAAAMVGGIVANASSPGDFIMNNLQIEINVIDACFKYGTSRLLFLGSSCIYPRDCPQPIREEYLMTGPLESTNEAYAISKIAGIKACQFLSEQYGTGFISAMPSNLYGPGDNFHPVRSHVIPGLIRKFHESKSSGAPDVTLWGTGSALREFTFVDDLADACLLLMDNYFESGHINIGYGDDISIHNLALLVQEIVGYNGKIIFDSSVSDGTPRKLMDSSKILAMGWRPKISLREGLKISYDWFLKNIAGTGE